MDLVEVEWSVVNWIGLNQTRYKGRVLVIPVMNFRDVKCFETTEWLQNLWSGTVLSSTILFN
jgi:hypothetical protein